MHTLIIQECWLDARWCHTLLAPQLRATLQLQGGHRKPDFFIMVTITSRCCLERLDTMQPMLEPIQPMEVIQAPRSRSPFWVLAALIARQVLVGQLLAAPGVLAAFQQHVFPLVVATLRLKAHAHPQIVSGSKLLRSAITIGHTLKHASHLMPTSATQIYSHKWQEWISWPCIFLNQIRKRVGCHKPKMLILERSLVTHGWNTANWVTAPTFQMPSLKSAMCLLQIRQEQNRWPYQRLLSMVVTIWCFPMLSIMTYKASTLSLRLRILMEVGASKSVSRIIATKKLRMVAMEL